MVNFNGTFGKVENGRNKIYKLIMICFCIIEKRTKEKEKKKKNWL